jgi:2-polyprenyl-3-methyl-5-hydroxy-6-metoxy-1,4-benzoquinol methylase
MARQAAALEQLISSDLSREVGTVPIRLLDGACGIGTQSIPLAQRGFEVTARDIAPGAIARLRREAASRRLVIDADVCDMRQLASSVSGLDDVVLALDNAIPHLLSDGDILSAFRQFREVLRPGGLCVISVRDYDAMERGSTAIHCYGERSRDGETFRLRQEWTWEDMTHYQLAFIVERKMAKGFEEVLHTVSGYYAVSAGRLVELMGDANLVGCRRLDGVLYQPILMGLAE